jgi:hypothetical protein
MSGQSVHCRRLAAGERRLFPPARLGAAGELAKRSEQLTGEVDAFLAGVKAA